MRDAHELGGEGLGESISIHTKTDEEVGGIAIDGDFGDGGMRRGRGESLGINQEGGGGGSQLLARDRTSLARALRAASPVLWTHGDGSSEAARQTGRREVSRAPLRDG